MTQASVGYTITKNWYTKLSMQAFWGDWRSKGDFAGLIDTSEITLKVGFQW
jgi:hypothetical protein